MAENEHRAPASCFDLLDDGELLKMIQNGCLDDTHLITNDEVTVTQILGINTQELVAPRAQAQRESTATHGQPQDCPSRSRFGSPISEQAIRQKNVGAVPKNTRKVNDWSTKVWAEWAKHRNAQPVTPLEPGFPIPEDIGLMTDDMINYWGQRFIMEIKRQDGTDYPPNSVQQIVCGLQRYLRSVCNRSYVNFMKEGTQFNDLRKCLDTKMKELFGAGVGAKRSSSDPVTMDDELKLWESDVFNSATATGLSNIVFYYNGKLFGFRGFQEHVNAQANQFDIIMDTEHNLRYILYTPGQRKNCQGGLKGRKYTQEPIRHYEQPDRVHNLVDLYERYLFLIPRSGPLYRKPLESCDENNNPKFSCATISQTGIKNMMKRFFAEAGIDTSNRKITNHSARVALCTSLYNQKFTDKAVTSRSKHKSNAVQAYQREQFEILNDISNALEPVVKKPKPSATITSAEVKSESTKPAIVTPAVPAVVTPAAPAVVTPAVPAVVTPAAPVVVTPAVVTPAAVTSSENLVIHVPNCVKSVVIVKSNGKKITIDV